MVKKSEPNEVEQPNAAEVEPKPKEPKSQETVNSDPACPMRQLLRSAHVVQDGKVEFGSTKYNYASAEAVFTQIRQAMHSVGLHVAKNEIVSMTHSTYQNARGVPQNYCVIHNRIWFADELDNEFGPYEGVGSGADGGDKAAMKAMTTSLKYAIAQSCLISWGDDPEADRRTDMHAAAEPEPKGLSAEARECLGKAKEVATKGLAELQRWWKSDLNAMFPNALAIKKELSPTPDWQKVKDIAKAADAKRARAEAGESDEAPSEPDKPTESSDDKVDAAVDAGEYDDDEYGPDGGYDV